MRIKNMAIVIYICFFTLVTFQSGLVQENRKVIFNWAFLLSKGDGPQHVVDFSNPVTVASEDKLQILLEPENEVFLYLFHFGTNQELNLLYPEHPDYYDTKKPNMESILLPGPDSRYQFDDSKGIEKFFLLASCSRLEELESVTRDYLREDRDKGELKARILDMLQTINREHSKLSGPTKKGVSIAGTIRNRNIPLLENVTVTEILRNGLKATRL